MDGTFPRTIQIDGRTIVVTATTAVEVLGSGVAAAVAAPEVAAALAGGVALGSIAATLPVKQLSREDAMKLGADERARFGGSVAAMEASGHLQSPFQNAAYVDSLPTQAQILATVPHPVPMNAPSIALTPTLPTDRLTTYPGYAPPIDQIHLPGAPGHAGVDFPGMQGLEAVPYVDSKSLVAGRDALARIEKCGPEFQSFKSFSSLQRSINSPPGWDDHHIVEQTRGTPLFGTEVIQNTSNVIPLPDAVHKIISAQYSSKFVDRLTGTEYSHYRDYMEKQPFERQRELGVSAVSDAIDQAEAQKKITPELADKLRADLQKLDRPELCAPAAPKIDPNDLLPSIDDLNKVIDGHNQQSDRRLPSARNVSQWDGSTRSGTFVDVGDGRVAQHQGQGAYAVADVRQQLGGVMPPIGQYATLQQSGQVQVPQQTHSLGMQLG